MTVPDALPILFPLGAGLLRLLFALAVDAWGDEGKAVAGLGL